MPEMSSPPAQPPQCERTHSSRRHRLLRFHASAAYRCAARASPAATLATLVDSATMLPLAAFPPFGWAAVAALPMARPDDVYAACAGVSSFGFDFGALSLRGLGKPEPYFSVSRSDP
eukprot:scaffold202145_cov29-Tisochrysis_lutea.AAC.4